MSNNETLSLEIGTWAQTVSITDVPKHVQDQALLNILDAVGIAFASTHYEFATRSIAASVARRASAVVRGSGRGCRM